MGNTHLPSSPVTPYFQCYSIATAPNIALMGINIYANTCLVCQAKMHVAQCSFKSVAFAEKTKEMVKPQRNILGIRRNILGNKMR